MTIEELRRALSAVVQQGGPLSSAEPQSDFQSFDQLLSDFSDLSVSEFCTKARDGLQKKVKAKKASSSAPNFNDLAVGRYVVELNRTSSDSGEFEKVVNRMKGDKAVRIDEVREIARRFVEGTRTYKTKTEAFKAILGRQITDKRAADKRQRISEIF